MTNNHGGKRAGAGSGGPRPGAGRKPQSFALKLGDSFYVTLPGVHGDAWTVTEIHRNYILLKAYHSDDIMRIER